MIFRRQFGHYREALPRRLHPICYCLLAIIIPLLAGGCGSPQPDEAVLDAGVAFAQAAIFDSPQRQTYRIGINTEVTGTGAQIGDLSIRAARLAVEEINAAGGVGGVPLELVVRDCRSNATIAVEQYRQAIADDRLVALLGPLKSAYAVQIVPEHRGNPLPLFIGATNTTLTEQGDQHLFRMRPSDRLTAAAMVAQAVEQLNAKRVGIIHDSDAFGSGGAERIVAELAQRNMTPVKQVSYITGSKDFDPLILAIKDARADTVLIYGTNSIDLGVLLRAMRYWKLEATIITTPSGASVVTQNVAAEAQDGIYVATDAVFDATPAGTRFEQAFLKRFGVRPDTYVAWYYDTIYLLAAVLRESGTDPQTLSSALRRAAYQGAQGTYRFDAAGEGLHQVALVRMAQGRLLLEGTYSADGFARTPTGQASAAGRTP